MSNIEKHKKLNLLRKQIIFVRKVYQTRCAFAMHDFFLEPRY